MNSNNVRIADSIRKGKNAFSKKDIAADTGMAWGTMYKTVENLLKRDVISARRGKPISSGRPSIPLCINGESVFWAGIDIGASRTRILFCDLNFNRIYMESVATKRFTSIETFQSDLVSFYRSALERSHLDASKIGGIGLSVSGNVDSENGIIVSGGNFGMKYGADFPMKNLSLELGFPVYAVTTQVASVCAEYHFGEKAGCPNLVTIGLGVGIGSGVIANRQLLTSHPKHPVGYIGHILIPGNRHRCTCGFTGCLEAYSGGDYLRKVAMEKVPNRPELHDAAMLDRAAALGDPDALRIMTTAASYNAVGVAAMIQLYAPEAIVFSGGQCRADGFLYRVTLDKLKEILPEERRNCNISITVLGEYQPALGAARLAYEKFF